jgi:hypothetical protein
MNVQRCCIVAVGFGHVLLLDTHQVPINSFLVSLQYFFRVFRVGMNLRSTVIVAVYQKAIKLSLSARQSRSVGEIVNIMSTGSHGHMFSVLLHRMFHCR